MQVVTLTPEGLDAHAGRLAAMVMDSHPPYLDAIVAVRRGGAFVCDAFCRSFPREMYGLRADVSLQRPSTKRKSRGVGRLLRKLPTPLLDLMRMAESMLLDARRRHSRQATNAYVELPDTLKKAIQKKDRPAILIIDDAIDSGDTLFAIVEALKKTNPDVTVRTAVLTETTLEPCIRADYSLYRNRTLIRFPWSNDYKNH